MEKYFYDIRVENVRKYFFNKIWNVKRLIYLDQNKCTVIKRNEMKIPYHLGENVYRTYN